LHQIQSINDVFNFDFFFSVALRVACSDDSWSECLWCGKSDSILERAGIGEQLFEYCWTYDDALILLEEERCHDGWRRYLAQTDIVSPVEDEDDSDGVNADDDDHTLGVLHFGQFHFGFAEATADVYDAHHASADSLNHIERIYQLDRALGVDRHVAVVHRTLDACRLSRLMSSHSERLAMSRSHHSSSSTNSQRDDSAHDDDDDQLHDDDTDDEPSSRSSTDADHQLVSLGAKIARLRAVCAAANNGSYLGILANTAPYKVLILGTLPRRVRRPRPSTALALAAAVDLQARARALDKLPVEELYRYLAFVYLTDTWSRMRHTLVFETADHNPNVLVVEKSIGSTKPPRPTPAMRPARRFPNITAVVLSATEIKPEWSTVRDISGGGSVCSLSCNATTRTTACKGLNARIDTETKFGSKDGAFELFGALLGRVCDVPHQLEWRLESVDINMILARKDLWEDDADLRQVLQRRVNALRDNLHRCTDVRRQIGCDARGSEDQAHKRQQLFAEAVEFKLYELWGGAAPIILGGDDSDESSPSALSSDDGGDGGDSASASSSIEAGTLAREYLALIKANQFSRWSPTVVRLRLKGCMLRRQVAIANWQTGEVLARATTEQKLSEAEALTVFASAHMLGHTQKLIFRGRAFGLPFVVKMVPPMAFTEKVTAEEAARIYAANKQNLRHEQRVLALLDKHHSIARLYASCASDDEPDLLNWTNVTVGNAAQQAISRTVYGAVGVDFVVVEELQELTTIIDDGSLASFAMLRDRVSLVRSVVELLRWLGVSAPGAPWHMCSLHAKQFGVGRNSETGLAEVRLLDADELYSEQYAGLEADKRDCAIADDTMVVGPTLVLEFVMPIWRPVQKTLPCDLQPLVEDTAWTKPGFLQTALVLLTNVTARLYDDDKVGGVQLCDMSKLTLFVDDHRDERAALAKQAAAATTTAVKSKR
jgi:hypothetical protein